jgi:hypothetical protein
LSRTIHRFGDMLALLSRGHFLEKCDEHLATSIAALEALPGEKGTARITVELTINYQSGRIDVRPAVKSKLPEEKGFADTPFWAHEGGLSVQHPSQIDMFGGPRAAEERGQRETA